MTRSIRGLARTPGYFALAVAALALGAGSATVMFSLAESVLWRPLPFPDPERLVLLFTHNPRSVSEGEPVSRAEFREWRERARSFRALAASGYASAHDASANGSGERIHTQSVTANFFETLGAKPALGSGFAPEDDRIPARVAVLTDAYWRSRFAADPAAIGRTVKIDGVSYAIAGVLPEDFHLDFRHDPDLYLPLDVGDPGPSGARHELAVIGRLRDGVDIASAKAEMQTIAKQSAAMSSSFEKEWTVVVENLRISVTKYMRGRLMVFFGFAALALLVACANIAALQLARYEMRRHESAMRLALGANRRRLLREAMSESAWIAGPGAAAGALFASWGLDTLRKFISPDEFVRGEQIRMDPWALAFVLAICASATVLFALAPVFSAGKVDVIGALRESARGATTGAGTLFRMQTLIAGEIALAFVLLFAAGLFVRSHAALLHVELGFEPAHVAAMRISPGASQRLSAVDSLPYFERVLETAAAIPGIRRASISGGLPLVYDSGVNFRRPGGVVEDSLARLVSADYFGVMSIPLMAGRGFNDRDSRTAPRVAIVNQRLAARMFGAENPVGKTIEFVETRSASIAPGPVQIVGVAGNTKEVGLNEIDFGDIYLPIVQNVPRTVYLAFQAQGDANAAIATMRRQLHALDPDIVISDAASMENRVNDGLSGNRFYVFLVGVFAGLAALLAGVGIYGAIAFAVARRTREFGLRVALGARPASILGLALSRACAIALAGGLCGFVAAWVLGSALQQTLYLEPGKHTGMLFGVGVHDAVSFLAAAAATLGLSAAAAFAPSLQAARVDPVSALRQE